VEALNTTTIRRLTSSSRHQLLAIALTVGIFALGPTGLTGSQERAEYLATEALVRAVERRKPTCLALN
jgi:hypothetical protein